MFSKTLAWSFPYKKNVIFKIKKIMQIMMKTGIYHKCMALGPTINMYTQR